MFQNWGARFMTYFSKKLKTVHQLLVMQKKITCPNLKNNVPVFICWMVFLVNLKSPASTSERKAVPPIELFEVDGELVVF
jgi:hypothetical protein